MNSMVVRVVMASLFMVVFIAFWFILAALTVGDRIGVAGMMFVLLISGVLGWVIGLKLFRVRFPQSR